MKKSFFIVLLFIVQINCVPNDSIIQEIAQLLKEEVLFLSDHEILQIVNQVEDLEKRLNFFCSRLNELKKSKDDFSTLLQKTERFLSDIILCIPNISNKYSILLNYQDILKYKQQHCYTTCSDYCDTLISLLNEVKNPILKQKNFNVKTFETNNNFSSLEKEILKKLSDKIFGKIEEQKVKVLESPITIFAEYEGLPTESKDILDFFSVNKINKIQLLRYYKLTQLTKDYVSFYQEILAKLFN
ncbi:hypothetical protein M1446_04535 [Candidatus Dependentiae bacterium]|nr:hypothetical protein [Candidatus Dependentiae bacterium]